VERGESGGRAVGDSDLNPGRLGDEDKRHIRIGGSKIQMHFRVRMHHRGEQQYAPAILKAI